MSYKILPPTLNLPLWNASGDQIDYTIYDRLQLNSTAGTNEREFFTIGMNQEDPVSGVRKTKADTNFRGGRISEGKGFGCAAFKMVYECEAGMSEATRVLQRKWIHGAYIEFLIDSKNEYGTWKVSELLGFVDDAQVAAEAAGPATEGSQGEYKGIKRLNLYIPLPRLTTFSVQLTQKVLPDSALEADFIYLGLVGILNRAG